MVGGVEMATIKDVAERAGVSISAVSYALNNKGKISDSTKQVILAAAKELDYIPNSSARALKGQGTNTVGIFLWNFFSPVFAQLLEGIHDMVVKHYKYDCVVGSVFGHESSTATKFIQEKRVDAAIVLCDELDSEFLKKNTSEEFPIVVLDREIDHQNMYSVLLDNEGGAFSAVEHMLRLKLTRVATITGDTQSYDSRMRHAGYRRALQHHDLPYDAEIVEIGYNQRQGGYYAMKNLLNKDRTIDGVFCSNDDMAIGAMDAIVEAGLSIPQDIAIMGFDDIPLSQYITPSLSTVKNPAYEWGVIAAQTVVNALKKEKESHSRTIPTQIVIRDSCGTFS